MLSHWASTTNRASVFGEAASINPARTGIPFTVLHAWGPNVT